MKKRFLFSLISLLLAFSGISQQGLEERFSARQILQERGEVYLSIPRNQEFSISDLSGCVDIDNVLNDKILAYANAAGFEQFLALNPRFEVLPAPSLLINHQTKNENLRNSWDYYPSWQVYLEIMHEFPQNYPQYCRIDTIGYSENGKEILVVSLASDFNSQEPKSAVYLTSTMHGDETTGYVLLIRMIDYLLSSYGTDAEVNDLLDNTVIYINPLANPDGAYAGGDQSVNGATRYNANSIDLNRNFPDAQFGNHPDNHPWQSENLAQMEFMLSHPIHLAMNIHGGTEVVNYPWDTWEQRHADDAWYEAISRAFADTVHAYAPAGWESYLTSFNNGITHGYSWYSLTGGRQDFMNYYAYGREVTYEISNVKMPAGSSLPAFWEANYRSILQYMQQVHKGFSGLVTDAVTTEPLRARIQLLDHDIDHSEVYSAASQGFYSRQVYPGTYTLVCSAPGYYSQTVYAQSIQADEALSIDFQLIPVDNAISGLSQGRVEIYPNPAQHFFTLHLATPVYGLSGQIISIDGKLVQVFEIADAETIVPVNLPAGLYIVRVGEFLVRLAID